MSWIAEHLAPLMFIGMILFMLIGYPAAFSLAATGLFFGFLGIEFELIRPDFLGNLTYQLFGIISNDLLLAIPFFTFMGAISMTPMLKYGYSVRHTMGVIAASGTITQLIPPSLVLVVLADQMGRSVGDMYAGAIGP